MMAERKRETGQINGDKRGEHLNKVCMEDGWRDG